MEAPSRSFAKRRAAKEQMSTPSLPQNMPSETSPSPFASAHVHVHATSESGRPKSRQTVALGWVEDDDVVSQQTSRLEIDLTDCVETKTVTTTTTTKRSYPPLVIPQKSLQELDPKEYPLASKRCPPDLINVSYGIERRSSSRVVDRPTTEAPRAHPKPQAPKRIQKRLVEPRRSKAYNTPTTEKQELLIKQLAINQRRAAKGVPEVDFTRSRHNRHTESQNTDEQSSPAVRQSHGLGLSHDTTFPATPDLSELDLSLNDPTRTSSFFERTYTPQSGASTNDSFEEPPSPSEAASQDAFASAVATPPIADSDLERFDRPFASSFGLRHGLNTSAAQNASLPSPGLSPTIESAELGFSGGNSDDEYNALSPETQAGDSQDTLEFDHDHLLQAQGLTPFQSGGSPSAPLTVKGVETMIQTFDSMPNDLKTLMMYQLLRRCSRKTLQVVANVVNPALRCDFLVQLPLELGLNILSFLDHKDLCRAAQVSKQWRNIIDCNETGWKELFDKDGYVLPMGELERAIQQGWGWQDPYGIDGAERDLSVTPSDADPSLAIEKVEPTPSRKVRSGKRKRTVGFSSSSKRRAVGHEFADKAQGMLARYPHTSKLSKSEGPLTAANAAAIAVPEPEIGIPSLRKLHLFKSLYRRHYMLHHSWMSGKVEPNHFAFPAHPSHVITCLQFDDDKIITGSDDTFIHVYDTKTGKLRKKLEGHEGGVWALQYEGNVLVSGSTDRSVRVWDIEKGLCTQVFHGHTSTVRCLQILMPEMTGKTDKGKPIMVPEKPLIITGSRDSQLRVWRLPEQGAKRYIQTGPPANDADCPYFVRVLPGHTHSVRAIAAHQDTLVSGSYDNTVRVWRISTGEVLHKLVGHSMKVYSVVLDHKRNRCISGSMDNYVKIWSLETGACLFTLEGHSSLVGLLDLRDERLVSAAADSTLRIWDPENGQCKSTLSAHTGAITCFQHDGQKVISGSDRTLKLWNIKTGECMKDLLTDLSGVWQVKFDERRCVAAVQRDNLTYVEVLDFGASRDGIPSSQRGSRRLLDNDHTPRAITVEDDDVDA